jgi:hypothetical protein
MEEGPEGGKLNPEIRDLKAMSVSSAHFIADLT